MNNIVFVEKVKEILKQDTVFAYGTYNELVTRELIARVYETQRKRYHADDDLHELYQHLGKYAYECSAVATVPLKWENPPMVNDIYKMSKKQYVISEMPDIVGLGVFLHGHMGVYIGNGEVIECTYVRKYGFGVVKTKLNERPWTTAFEIPNVQYTT